MLSIESHLNPQKVQKHATRNLIRPLIRRNSDHDQIFDDDVCRVTINERHGVQFLTCDAPSNRLAKSRYFPTLIMSPITEGKQN